MTSGVPMTEAALQNHVVVITGASGRLGRALLPAFAEHGARVAAVTRREDNDLQRLAEASERIATFIADATDEESVRRCFGEIAERCGSINVLVHAVGRWEARAFLEVESRDWDALLRQNLFSAFLCFREAVRRISATGGRLIGIASAQGADRARPEQAAYAASKAGLIRLVESVDDELQDRGIRAFVIAPSFIQYDQKVGADGVTVADLVEIILFLCTPAADLLGGHVIRAYRSTS
jgi:3-oxoacyl-[acyl-carrier protein] reductase